MFLPPKDPADFRAFCYALGKRYIPHGVTAWELGNEPNHSRFWQPRPSAKEYVELYLKPGAEGLRQAANELGAEVTILGGSMAPASREEEMSPDAFLRAVYEFGGGPFMDAVAHHPYTYPLTPRAPDRWLMRTRELFDIMDERGDTHKRIWATEVGYASGSDRRMGAVSEEVQALWAEVSVRAWSELGERAGPFFWYQHRDHGPNLNEREQNFGLWRHEAAPKPAMEVLSNALKETGTGTINGDE